MTEMHDFVDEMTKGAGEDDAILVCGDFNMFMQEMSKKAKHLIHKYNSWEIQRKITPGLSE
jgi:hypothetical protein